MIRLRVGDVFTVPTGDGRAGIGQLVAKYGEDVYYFAIFDYVLPMDEAPVRALEALSSPVLFLAPSFDAKVYVGDWVVVAHAPVDPAMPLPAYKIARGCPGNFFVEDYSGKLRRRATAAEVEAVPYREIVAPVGLEMALRATLGLAPWLDDFDALKVEGRPTTAEIF